MERTKGKIETERLPEKLEFELTLPVWVKQSGVYWEIVDSNGKIFMGRKQKDAIEAIALFLNNFDEMASRWNAFEEGGLAGELKGICKWINSAMDESSEIWCAIRKLEGSKEWVRNLEAVLIKATEVGG